MRIFSQRKRITITLMKSNNVNTKSKSGGKRKIARRKYKNKEFQDVTWRAIYSRPSFGLCRMSLLSSLSEQLRITVFIQLEPNLEPTSIYRLKAKYFFKISNIFSTSFFKKIGMLRYKILNIYFPK